MRLVFENSGQSEMYVISSIDVITQKAVLVCLQQNKLFLSPNIFQQHTLNIKALDPLCKPSRCLLLNKLHVFGLTAGRVAQSV
jgi:hypothetical protein